MQLTNGIHISSSIKNQIIYVNLLYYITAWFCRFFFTTCRTLLQIVSCGLPFLKGPIHQHGHEKKGDGTYNCGIKKSPISSYVLCNVHHAEGNYSGCPWQWLCDALASCDNLTGHFKYSHANTAELKVKQTSHGQEEKSFVRNFTLKIIKWVQQNKDPWKAMLTQQKAQLSCADISWIWQDGHVWKAAACS